MENSNTPEPPAPQDTGASPVPQAQPPVQPATPPAAPSPSGAPQAPEAQAPAPEQNAAARPEGAPEAYQPFDVPAGLPVDEGLMGEFATLAKELNLSQEAAQKLVSFQAKAALQERDAWYAASQADAEFGGQHLKTNLETALRAVDAFGTPELKRLLVDTGLGDHPEVIRMFYRAGKTLAPDRIVGGTSPAAGPARGLAERLYHTT